MQMQASDTAAMGVQPPGLPSHATAAPRQETRTRVSSIESQVSSVESQGRRYISHEPARVGGHFQIMGEMEGEGLE